MHDSRIFSESDLKRGFYQIGIEEKSQEYTAFTTQFGKYKFTKTPFGLINALKFFQNTLRILLKDVPNIAIFVDDIIIFTKTKAENIVTFKRNIQIFIDNNIVINFEKSEIVK